MQNFLGNLRYVLRQFRMSPVFTVAAMLTLALGIGGTTAIFTLIDAVMLRSLPVKDPAALYRIGSGDNCCVEGGPQDEWDILSFPFVERIRNQVPEFEQLAVFQAGRGRMSVRREGVDTLARPLLSEYVNGSYFSTLGVPAFGGRLFREEDDRPESAPVAVLSHHVWQTTYGGDTSILGSILIIEGHPFTVVGVAAPGFFGETLESDPPDLWLPLQQEVMMDGDTALLHQSISGWLRVIGRVRPGASVAAIGPRLTGILRQWMQHDAGYPANFMDLVMHSLPKQFINVVPAGAGVDIMKQEYGRSLNILFGVCGLVLLIACANVANLLLARGVARRGQTAVRLALGASRRQIISHALTESVLLAIGGGIAGLAVAVAAARLLVALAFQNAQFVPISTMPSLTVLAFAFAVSLLTGVIFGAAPAWFATRTDPADALRGSARSTSGHASLTRKALLLVQATLSVVLVAGSTMLGRSLNKLEHQNFGYPVPGHVMVSMNELPSTYSQSKLAATYRELETRLKRLPGVAGVGLAMYNPLTDNWGEWVLVAGHPAPKPGEEGGASWDRVSADYLQNLGMTLLRGRFFTAADNETAPVAIVNESFVKRFFKSNEDPMDQHFGLDLPENAGTYRIVGIVRDAKFAGSALNRPPRPMFYVPLANRVDYKNELMDRLEVRSHFIDGIMLKTDVPAGIIEPQVKRAMAEVDPNLTMVSVRTLEQQVAYSSRQDRAVASLAGLFGIVALLLASIGLYGVTAYSVAQRTQEIGIRMALGADRGKVVRLILGGASQRVLAGLILGVPLAIGAGKLISSKLYGVSFWDPLALMTAGLALAVSAFVAAMIPAQRAASISPMSALRIE